MKNLIIYSNYSIQSQRWHLSARVCLKLTYALNSMEIQNLINFIAISSITQDIFKGISILESCQKFLH